MTFTPLVHECSGALYSGAFPHFGNCIAQRLQVAQVRQLMGYSLFLQCLGDGVESSRAVAQPAGSVKAQ